MFGPANALQASIELPDGRSALRVRAVVRRRRVAIAGVAAAGLVCLMVALVGSLGAGRDGTRVAASQLGESAALAAPWERASFARLRRLDMARAVRRERWLGGPAASGQRLASRMAFHGLAAGASERLLVRDYGSVLSGVSGNPAASAAHLGRIVRYLSDYSALVQTRRGVQVETSTVPLRVADGTAGKSPVDLRLAVSGNAFAPARPLAGVSIAKDSGGGVAVGSDGMRLTLRGADVAGRTVGGQSVFFPGVARDMDAAVAPALSGAELFTVLRSRLSPQEIRYRVAVPAGAILSGAAGGAVISRAGRALARVPAPVARDAQGSPVPVRMRVVGGELLLDVAHRSRDVAYPVLVDPT